MNAPLLILSAFVMYKAAQTLRPVTKAVKSSKHPHCQLGESGCPRRPSPIHVDTAHNTTLRDDSQVAPHPKSILKSVTQQYQAEATAHPGVAIVAASIL
mmetsp:Transcript_23081/g.44917  ORF Transcript_23081/g.44917 Transcript_23081/m.44917 type:complete len:99 (+) Transcript_23081:1160-1456(+)